MIANTKQPLGAVQKQIEAGREELNDELRKLDSEWDMARADGTTNRLKKLENLYRLFGSYGRWGTPLQERQAGLSF